jgi:hypothetical protein
MLGKRDNNSFGFGAGPNLLIFGQLFVVWRVDPALKAFCHGLEILSPAICFVNKGNLAIAIPHNLLWGF